MYCIYHLRFYIIGNAIYLSDNDRHCCFCTMLLTFLWHACMPSEALGDICGIRMLNESLQQLHTCPRPCRIKAQNFLYHFLLSYVMPGNEGLSENKTIQFHKGNVFLFEMFHVVFSANQHNADLVKSCSFFLHHQVFAWVSWPPSFQIRDRVS